MPKLETYARDLPYSYALGIFPAMQCVEAWPEACSRLLVHSAGQDSEGVQKLTALARQRGLRVENADRVLQKLSGKDNCFAGVVFEKQRQTISAHNSHVVLHQPSDSGNLGTILRTCLGFGLCDIAIIRPAVDVYDPRTVRATMGALFHVRVCEFDDFAAYRQQYPAHGLYPFMLDGSVTLQAAVDRLTAPYALVFGNEATGLPAVFASQGTPVRIPHSEQIDSLNLGVAVAIGAYAFTQALGKEETRDGI